MATVPWLTQANERRIELIGTGLTPLPSAPALVCYQSMFQNLWNLWKWECGNSRDVTNLALVRSSFPGFQKPVAILRSAVEPAETGVTLSSPKRDFSEKFACAAWKSGNPQTNGQEKYWCAQAKNTFFILKTASSLCEYCMYLPFKPIIWWNWLQRLKKLAARKEHDVYLQLCGK